MGVNFNSAKAIAKTGTKPLIALIVLDTTWALIHFLLFNTVYFDEASRNRFTIIESIVTNILFVISISILTVGMMLFSIYYLKINILGMVGSSLLIGFIGIKIVGIVFRITQAAGDFNEFYMEMTFNIFELIASFLLIFSFILYDFFQVNLKKKKNIGFGRSPFPYIFGFAALIYPISYFLNILGVEYVDNNIVFSIMRTFAFIASILGIPLYFDLLRRFDSFKEVNDKEIEENESSS